MKEPKKEPSITELIAADEKRRIENCSKGIDETLKRFNCRLDVAVVLRQNAVIPQIQVLANPVK